MKRQAEKQISKDSTDEDDDSMPQTGFQKADETVLATRKIKGLPKRSQNNSNSSNEDSSNPPKFAGFGGFGPPASKSFTFIPPTMSEQPSVAPTASNAAKTLSGLLGAGATAPLAPAPTLSSVDESSDSEAAALKYYTSLRGLNVSFLSAIQKAVEDDPFADVAVLLDRYKSLRVDVQKEFDDAGAPPSRTSTQTTIPTMPTPPASFTGFGGFGQKSSSSSGSSTGSVGFTPTASKDASKPTPSPFGGFGSSSTSSTSLFSKPSTSSESLSLSKDSESKPAADSSTSTSLFGSSAKPPSSGFTFGASSTTTTTSPFGAPSSSNPFGAPKPNPFGAPSVPSSFLSSSSASSSTTPKPPTTFGGFGGFGSKPAGTTSPGGGSIGNPVGFGFGSPPKDGDSKPSGFTFGASSSSSSPSPFGSQKTEEASPDSTPKPEDAAKAEENPATALFGNSPHDEEGEGEEDEETTHSIRLKAFRLKKSDEGAAGWADLGTGVLRLKKHKETGARRMLLRNSSTGKITINFNLYGGLNPSQNKKAVMFVGHDEGGVSQTYNVRMKTEEQAADLKSALEREIMFVKAKSDA
ncbi:hypothetical protein VKT23_000706 [Stygiomarasmius scandens]|uniref:RanBD1 domain-containing protein n=1 Tax=Marasmiellus scandens TaxID=2682957 RepID=A0ABR1KA98_9AGAR